jgi:hypothetical protein
MTHLPRIGAQLSATSLPTDAFQSARVAIFGASIETQARSRGMFDPYGAGS